MYNTGDTTIENWMLYFEPNGDIQYLNDATQAATNTGMVYIKNAGYNASIDANASVTFSYVVNDCEEAPDAFTLCQMRSEKESGYEVMIQVNQFWGNSFNGEIILPNNTDAPIEAWKLTIDTNFTTTEITNSWAAAVTELESYSYILKGTYTGTIGANSSVSLGFIGVQDGEPEIISSSLTEVVVDENAILAAIGSDSDEEAFYDDCIDWSTLPNADADGLPDKFEEEYGCDSINSDTDGDGLSDGYEIMTVGSNPADANSLDETIPDGTSDAQSLCGIALNQQQQLNGDCNADGSTDAQDALTLMRFLVRIVNFSRCCYKLSAFCCKIINPILHEICFLLTMCT